MIKASKRIRNRVEMEGRSRVIENNKNRRRDEAPTRTWIGILVRNPWGDGGGEVSSISDTVGGQQVGKRLTPFSSRLSLA